MLRLAALVLALAPAAAAQVSLGPLAGANVSFAVAEESAAPELRPRVGLVAGFGLEVDLAPGLSLAPEVLYAETGFSQTAEAVPGSGVPLTLSTTRRNVEVPVLLLLRVPFGLDGLAVGFEAGPSFRIPVARSVACRGEGASCALYEAPDLEPAGVGVGATVGIAVLGSAPFGVGLRYTHSFGATEERADPAGAPLTVRAHTIAVTARRTFGRY